MYKIIVCDLDETLLNDEHEICESNIQAIKKASELGVKFIPATGRAYNSIDSILKTIDLYDKEKEYVISFNGGALTENKNNKILAFDCLPFDKANELFEFALEKDVSIHVCTAEERYIYKINEDERNRFVKQGRSYIEIQEPTIEFLKNAPIAKMIYQSINVPYLMSLEKEMKSMIEGHVSLSYSSNRYMELNKFGVNKGGAMLALAEILGVKKEETIAVGDNYNDMAMLAAAGLSVAAGNAVEDVKKACKYTCKNDNNQGVLAEVIERFILKKNID